MAVEFGHKKDKWGDDYIPVYIDGEHVGDIVQGIESRKFWYQQYMSVSDSAALALVAFKLEELKREEGR